MRYTKEQIQEIAKKAMWSRENNTFEYQQKVMMLASITKTSPEYVEKMIKGYSEGVGIS